MGNLVEDQCIKESINHSFLNSAPHSVVSETKMILYVMYNNCYYM